jgi:predicted permease
MAERRIASPGYFASLGIPVKAGREFAETDGVGADRSALINEALARAAFPDENPIGRRLLNVSDEPVTIVGVVGDVRQAGLDRPPLPEIYAPYALMDSLGAPDKMVLVVRAQVPATSLVRQVRAAVAAVDPTQPIFEINTMREVIGESLADRRMYLWLLGLFGGVALTLAAAGIYGVIAYAVAQRRREMGVRMALGARGIDVVGMVVRQGASLAGIGIVIGLVGSFGLMRFIASMLYGVKATDPVTFAVVPLVLGGVALLAAWLPARRAARVDPVVVLRAE